VLKATLGKEIVVRRTNEIGALADIAKTVAEKGIGILAVSGWVEGSEGVFRLLVDDALRAGDALRAKHYAPRESSVVIVELPHKPGLLKMMTEKLRDARIDLHHLYASAPSRAAECLVVFSSSDNQRAMVELNHADPPR
jgi:hypothetical protein